MDAGIPFGSGELTASLVRAARNPQSLRKWQVLKSWTTRIKVIRRFGKKYCSKKIQLSIQDLFEKSNVSESASTKNQPAAGCTPTSEAPFSPHYPLAQDEFNQTRPRVPTLEPQHSKGSSLKACGIFKDSSALSQILLALLGLLCPQEDSRDESTAGLIVLTVLVIAFTQRMEGTTATDLVRLILQFASKNQLPVLGFIIFFKISGVRAESSIETGKVEPDGWEMLYYAKVAALILLIGWLTFIARNTIDRQCPAAVRAGVPANDFIMEGLQRTDYRRTNSTLAIPCNVETL